MTNHIICIYSFDSLTIGIHLKMSDNRKTACCLVFDQFAEGKPILLEEFYFIIRLVLNEEQLPFNKAQELFGQIDEDKNKTIDKHEFASGICKLWENQSEDEFQQNLSAMIKALHRLRDLEQTFKYLVNDKNQLNYNDFKKILKHAEPSMNDQQFETFFNNLKVPGNQPLKRQEFLTYVFPIFKQHDDSAFHCRVQLLNESKGFIEGASRQLQKQAEESKSDQFVPSVV